ncbi:efflux RND transporter permease subunit [Roseivirga sp. BDSF3-8]|uniref:efflux RND transporter permease subunit n=1 Tax=Roseivirga sp. BDSF3-8 TaxID=3241598 RepID=UPI003531E821
MKKLVGEFIKFPLLANLIILVLLMGGIGAGLLMKKSFFPERSTNNITINVAMPGASPREMEEGVATKIEQAVKAIPGIKEIISTSSENSANVNITTYENYDIDEILTEVKNAVDQISSFPENAEKPTVFKRKNTDRGVIMVLHGDLEMMELKEYAQRVEKDLLNSGLISQVEISGYPTLEISVEVPEENLNRYNLTFEDIITAIRTQNRDISAGTLRNTQEEVLIRSRAKEVDPDEIGNITLRSNAEGTNLLIKDIADVKLQFAEQSYSVYYNGEQSVNIEVTKLPEEDLEAISSYVNNYAATFNEKHNDVNLTITLDFLNTLHSRLNLLVKNGVIGFFLIIVVLGLFLNLRLSMWVAMGIPISFMGMAIAAYFGGVTINMISLFGMILVVGILVDDGIVIAENIYTHFEKGKKPMKAALDGTLEVLPAVFTSVLTTIVAFTPLFFVTGTFEFFGDLAFVVVASLSFSLVEAFLVLPGHIGSKSVLKQQERKTLFTRIKNALENSINWVRSHVYGKVLKKALDYRYVSFALIIFFFLITIGMFKGGIIRYTFFPPIQFDRIEIGVAFKPGTGEAIVEDYLVRFEQAVRQVEDTLAVYHPDFKFIESTTRVTGVMMNGGESGSHTGSIGVSLEDMEGSPISTFQIAGMIRQYIGPVPEAEKFAVGGMNRWGKPVSIGLLGNDLEEMEGATEMLKEELAGISMLKDISDTDPLGRREVLIQPKEEAYFLGLDRNIISNQLRQGFFGGEAQRLQRGIDEVRVYVRYPREDRMNIGQLESAKIRSQSGEAYPLTQLVDYSIERGPSSIRHRDGSREITIEADLEDPYAEVPAILEKIRTDIEPKVLASYPGVRFSYEGQSRNSEESLQQMIVYLGLALIVIIIILIISFRSFIQAILVILMIPLGWIGACWGHGLEGTPVSLLSAWGMLALAGVVINDAVVFIDKYNRNLLEGEDIQTAIFNAGQARFRAILLTTITTVAGLYPLILEQSFQAQFLIPMAVSVAYGILFGTMFILIFLPVLVLVFNDLRYGLARTFGHKIRRERLEPSIKNHRREKSIRMGNAKTLATTSVSREDNKGL